MKYSSLVVVFLSLTALSAFAAPNISIHVTRLTEASPEAAKAVLGEEKFKQLRDLFPWGFLVWGSGITPKTPIMAMGGWFSNGGAEGCVGGYKGGYKEVAWSPIEASPLFGNEILGFSRLPLVVFPSFVLGDPSDPLPRFSPPNWFDGAPPGIAKLDCIILGDGTLVGEDRQKSFEQIQRRPADVRAVVEGMLAAPDPEAFLQNVLQTSAGWRRWAARKLLSAEPKDRPALGTRLLTIRGVVVVPQISKEENK